jgi:hypothetical protein
VSVNVAGASLSREYHQIRQGSRHLSGSFQVTKASPSFAKQRKSIVFGLHYRYYGAANDVNRLHRGTYDKCALVKGKRLSDSKREPSFMAGLSRLPHLPEEDATTAATTQPGTSLDCSQPYLLEPLCVSLVERRRSRRASAVRGSIELQ